MPVPIDSGDRKILIGAGTVLAVMLLGSLVVSVPEAGPSVFPSSYSAASDGAKVAYLLFGELGYEVQRWESPPTELLPEPQGHLLILAEPFPRASAAERQALRNFVRNGGTLLATGQFGAHLLPEGDTIPIKDEAVEWRTLHAAVPSPFTRGAQEIVMKTPTRWAARHFSHVGLYSDGTSDFVVTYRYGRGRVIWFAAPTPLTNAGISQKDNLILMLNTAGEPGQMTILWDEYFHGQRASLWAYLAPTPLPWAMAQLALIAMVLLLTFSRRSGPVRPAVAESRLSPLEFVDTMGVLYHRAHAASSGVTVVFQRFRFLLLRRLGLPSTYSSAQIYQSVRDRLGWKEPGFLETLQSAERAAHDPELTDEEALPLVQALDHYADLFALYRPSAKENR